MPLCWPSPLVVFTGRLAYVGPDRLDISPVTQDPLGQAFAPLPEQLTHLQRRPPGSPRGEAAWQAFVADYTEAMRASLRASLATPYGPWPTLLVQHEVTLVCLCVEPARCHRRVLAGLLGRCGARVEGERPAPALAVRKTNAPGPCLLPDAQKVLAARGADGSGR